MITSWSPSVLPSSRVPLQETVKVGSLVHPHRTCFTPSRASCARIWRDRLLRRVARRRRGRPAHDEHAKWHPDQHEPGEEDAGGRLRRVAPDSSHFGPSGMNSASRPSSRNHLTMARCGGISVP